MTADRAKTRDTFQHAYGVVSPPERITQEAFDRDDAHLRRLARLRPNERAEASDLWEYTQDLRYTEIQGPLVAYLLPFCLAAWREDLRGFGAGYGGFVEHLYPVLADRHIFDVHLTPKQTEAVSGFMREAILEEIDDQRGLAYRGMNARPYRWIRALTSYGVLLPDVQRAWTAWWSLETVGRAIAAAQYISCLMYSEDENPVFSPWTQDAGGGPPCLWEFEGHLYEHRWLEPNLMFLKQTLNVTVVSEVLKRAVERLTEQPEHEVATQVLTDLPLCIATLESRCAELPLLLQTTQEPASSLEWSI
jgi:hypothetical protein